MSAEAVAFAWRVSTLPAAKLVLLALAEGQNFAQIVSSTAIRAHHVELLMMLLESQGYVVYDGERWSVALPPPIPPPDPPVYRKVPIPSELREAVFARDGYRCVSCGSREYLCADHKLAEVLGGPATLSNLQTLCRSCNSRKGTRDAVPPDRSRDEPRADGG